MVSKHTIEQKLGCPVSSFSYPYAFPEADDAFKARLRDELQRSGIRERRLHYRRASLAVSDPFFLNRLPVNSDDDPRLFRCQAGGVVRLDRKTAIHCKNGKEVGPSGVASAR